MTEYIGFVFSGTLVHPNIFCLRLFRAFSIAGFTRKTLSFELNPPISAVQFSLTIHLHKLDFVQFCSLFKSKFFLDIVYNGENSFPMSFAIFELFGFKHWGLTKKSFNSLTLGSDSVIMLIRGVVAAMQVVKNHSKITPTVLLLYLKQFVFTLLSLFCNFKVATELRIQNFTVFRTVPIFILIFQQFLFFRVHWKSRKLFP